MKAFIVGLLNRLVIGALAGRLLFFLRHRPRVLGLANPLYVSHYFVDRDGARYLAKSGTCLATGSNAGQIVRFDATTYEPELTYLIETLIRPGDVVLDIGANVGLHTVAFAKAVGPTGQVFGFEPAPRMAEHNSMNCALNGLGNVTIVNCALGEEDTTVRMHMNVSDAGLEGTSSLLETVHIARRPENYAEQDVPVRRLDDLLPELGLAGPVRFIKIDTEGFEPMVLKGAMQCLRKDKPIMIVEAHSTRLRKLGLLFKWYLETFPDYHIFIVYALSPANPYFRLEPLTEEPPEICVNLLMLPRTKTFTPA